MRQRCPNDCLIIDNREEARFCTNCGAPTIDEIEKPKCPCRTELWDFMKFCPSCGKARNDLTRNSKNNN